MPKISFGNIQYDPASIVVHEITRGIDDHHWIIERIEKPFVCVRDGDEQLKVDFGEWFDKFTLPKVGESMRFFVRNDVFERETKSLPNIDGLPAYENNS